MSLKGFIFGVVSYWIFTGVFGMSFLGSFILSLICTAIIADIGIASNKSDDKEKNDHDENNGTQS